MAVRSLMSKVKHTNVILDILQGNNFSPICGNSLRLKYSWSTLAPCSAQSSTQNNFCNHFYKEKQFRQLHLTASREAGHSKWSNIKHVKGAQDKARGEKTSVLSRKVTYVLSKNSEKDPRLNTELANLIKWARTNSIPNDVIHRTIDRTIQLRDPSNLAVFEGRGPSNIAIVLECFTLKPVHTKGILQGVIKKYGFNLNTTAEDLFDHKGIVEAEVPESELELAQKGPDAFPLDKYIDIAIEAGAEDVTLQGDAEKPYLEFICGPMECDKVQNNVEQAGLTVSSSERSYIPTVEVPASKDYLDSLEILKEKLDKHPDVMKYYFNIVPEQ